MTETETINGTDLVEEQYGSGKPVTKKEPKKESAKPEAKQEQPLGKKEEPIEPAPSPAPDAKKEEGKKEEPKKEEAKKGDDKKIITDTTTEFFDPSAPIERKNKAGTKKQEANVPADGKTKSPEDLERERLFPTYEKAHKTLEKLSSSPLGKILLQAETTGVDPIQLLTDLTPKDYDKIDDRQRANDYYSKIQELTGEDLEQAVDEFCELKPDSTSYKLEKRKQIKELTANQNTKLQSYIEKKTSSDQQELEVISTYESDITNLVGQAKKAKQLYGMQLTDDEFVDLEREGRGYSLIDEEGYVKAGDVLALLWFKKHGRERFRQIGVNAESKGREEVLEKVIMPDANNEGTNNRRMEAGKTDGTQMIEDRFGKGSNKKSD